MASPADSPRFVDVGGAVAHLLMRRKTLPAPQAVLAGVSGIDGAGKGYVAERIVDGLRAAGLRVAPLCADGWLDLPHVRFDPARPGERFYERALRLETMFEELVLPLRERRSLTVEVDHAEETAASFGRRTYAFESVDVIVVEGIFLFKRSTRGHFDAAIWVDCSFETALERAVRRAQEGLPPEETIRAYETIYFPAQRIHLAKDAPRVGADLVLPNDPRLSDPSQR